MDKAKQEMKAAMKAAALSNVQSRHRRASKEKVHRRKTTVYLPEDLWLQLIIRGKTQQCSMNDIIIIASRLYVNRVDNK